jgi:hypothetical protein
VIHEKAFIFVVIRAFPLSSSKPIEKETNMFVNGSDITTESLPCFFTWDFSKCKNTSLGLY